MNTNKTVSVKMLAFTPCVNSLAIQQGVSTVQLLNSVNAELGKATLVSGKGRDGKLGATRIRSKAGTASTNEDLGSLQWENKDTPPMQFKAFNDMMARAEKAFPSFGLSSFPASLESWIAKHKAAPAPADKAPAKNGKADKAPAIA